MVTSEGESWNFIDDRFNIVDTPPSNGSTISSKVTSPSVISLSDDEGLISQEDFSPMEADDELSTSESCYLPENPEIMNLINKSVNALNIDTDSVSDHSKSAINQPYSISDNNQQPILHQRKENLISDTVRPDDASTISSANLVHSNEAQKHHNSLPIRSHQPSLLLIPDATCDESFNRVQSGEEFKNVTETSEAKDNSTDTNLSSILGVGSTVEYYIYEAEVFKGKARAAMNELYRISSELSSSSSPNSTDFDYPIEPKSIGIQKFFDGSAFQETFNSLPKAADSFVAKLYEFSEFATDRSMWVAQEINRRTNEVIDNFNIDEHERALEGIFTNALGAMSNFLELPSARLPIDLEKEPPLHYPTLGLLNPIENHIAHTLVIAMERDKLPRFDGTDFNRWISSARPYFEQYLIQRADIYLIGIKLYSTPAVIKCLECIHLTSNISVEEMLTRLHNFFEDRQIYEDPNEPLPTKSIYI